MAVRGGLFAKRVFFVAFLGCLVALSLHCAVLGETIILVLRQLGFKSLGKYEYGVQDGKICFLKIEITSRG